MQVQTSQQKRKRIKQMSSKLSVQNPISAGQIIGAYNASGVSDTDWHSLTSSDFYDPTSGSQIDASLQFAYLGAVSSNTTSVSYVKLRAAAGAGDGVTNTDGVIPLLSSYSVDSQALATSNITSIAYKKADSADSFVIYCGFNRG
jgi:hypothetical protein